MRDIPKYGEELATLTKRSNPQRKLIGSITKAATKRRARSASTSAAITAAPLPENVAADVLRNVVFDDLCALLNSATVFARFAPYKRYVGKMCVNIS